MSSSLGSAPSNSISRRWNLSRVLKACQEWELVSEKGGPEDQATVILARCVAHTLLLWRLRAQTSKLHQKRKREAGQSSPQDQDRPPSKRPRTSSPSCKAEGEPQKEAESDTSKNNADPVETWIRTNKWPSQYVEQDSQAGQDFFEHDSWLEEQMEQSSTPIPSVLEAAASGPDTLMYLMYTHRKGRPNMSMRRLALTMRHLNTRMGLPDMMIFILINQYGRLLKFSPRKINCNT